MVLELTSLVSSLSNLLAKNILEIGGRIFQELSDQAQQGLFHASKQYVERYASRHAMLKVLEMSEPVALESVYTSTRLWSEPRFKRLESPDELEKLCQALSQTNLNLLRPPKLDGSDVVNAHQYLVILGQPGAGKSTFLRWTGWEALKGKDGELRHSCIPVFVELKHLPFNQLDLTQAIVSEFEICGFPAAHKFVTTALKQGRLLILLDGLDEITQHHRNRLIDAIQNFVDCYRDNRFILSCRTPAYFYNLSQFVDFEVADFDDGQIERFIRNWFSSDLDQRSETAGRLWRDLLRLENAPTRDLARTPLLLAFICLVYDRDTSLPDNRGLLYGKALDILLRRWSAERRIERDPIYQGLYPELEKLLLSEIAYQGFIAEQLFFSEQSVLQQIQSFLSNTLDAPPYLDAVAVLQAIEEQHGILLKQAEGVFSFSHLTLQEYLTARYIAVDQDRVQELISSHLGDSRWHEIFLLVAGLIQTGDKLLLRIEEAARQYINTPRLHALMSWVEFITSDPFGERGSLSQRIFATLIALTSTQDHVFARALILLRALAFLNDPNLAGNVDSIQVQAHTLASNFSLALIDLTYELACQLNSLGTFKRVNLTCLSADIAVLRSSHRNTVSEDEAELLWRLWLDAFQLNPELVKLSQSEIKNLECYLDANLLLLQCKKASVRVLRTTWEELEQRMLVAPQL